MFVRLVTLPAALISATSSFARSAWTLMPGTASFQALGFASAADSTILDSVPVFVPYTGSLPHFWDEASGFGNFFLTDLTAYLKLLLHGDL